MNDFGIIYDQLSSSINEINDSMNEIYDKEGASAALLALANAQKNMLVTLFKYTDMYCKDDNRDMLLNNIQYKIDSLDALVNQTTFNSGVR